MNYLTHTEPLEREQANWIAQLAVEAGYREQIWCERIDDEDDALVRLRCIPFFVYGVALHDVIRIDYDTSEFALVQDEGNSTLRIKVGPLGPPAREALSTELASLGAQIEISSESFWAVSVARTGYEAVAQALSQAKLEWETGKA